MQENNISLWNVVSEWKYDMEYNGSAQGKYMYFKSGLEQVLEENVPRNFTWQKNIQQSEIRGSVSWQTNKIRCWPSENNLSDAVRNIWDQG